MSNNYWIIGAQDKDYCWTTSIGYRIEIKILKYYCHKPHCSYKQVGSPRYTYHTIGCIHYTTQTLQLERITKREVGQDCLMCRILRYQSLQIGWQAANQSCSLKSYIIMLSLLICSFCYSSMMLLRAWLVPNTAVLLFVIIGQQTVHKKISLHGGVRSL